LPASQLAFYDTSIHDFKVEPGTFDVLVGDSSDDILLRGHIDVTPR
jgi:beta-glucosidase